MPGFAEAFGESLEEHRGKAAGVLAEKLRHGGVDSFVVGAFDKEGLAGTAGFYRERTKNDGIRDIFGACTLRMAKPPDGLRSILISVSEMRYGVEPGAPRVGDRYLDEEFFELRLY